MGPSIAGLAVVLAATAFAAGLVAAEGFKLSYSFSIGSVLEADVVGELQADGDTVIVSAVESARLDGEAGPVLP